MKDSNWDIRKKERAAQIFDEFSEFTDGCRTLLLMYRRKEGGDTNNTKVRKKVTRGPKEFKDALLELVSEKMDSELPLRIYSSVNERDIAKAIRKFKHEQLDADDFSEDQRDSFYLDAHNRFFGCLMSPTSKATSRFLFDIDNEEGRDVFSEALSAIPSDKIVMQYRTRNGWHVVTEPFNHTTVQLPRGVELKTDGLLLLDF